MKKVAIIYWSGTGNTQIMASAIAEGAKEAGAEVNMVFADVVDTEIISGVDGIALGCPSMGAEQLEESIMEPLMCELDTLISGKNVVLFGSYGWGNGEWMQDWEERVTQDGAILVNGEGIIANGAPDEESMERCKDAGRTLAG